MVYLANAHTVVTVLFEDLRERDGIGLVISEVGLEIPDLDGVGTKPCQQTGPRRIADCGLAMSLGKQDAVLRQLVDMGARNMETAITAQFRAQVVHCNEQYVGHVLGRTGRKPSEQGGQDEA